MAQLIVRPASDVSLSSNNTYSSGTSAYRLINEATSDDATTYVVTSTTGNMFIVLCGGVDTSKIKTINSLTVYVRGTSLNGASISFGFNAPSSAGSSASISTSYATFSYKMTVNQTPANFNLSNIQLYVNANSITVADKISGSVSITQMYVVIDYVEKTVTAYIKIDGAWKAASAVYIKIDGVWKTVASIYDKISDVWHTG